MPNTAKYFTADILKTFLRDTRTKVKNMLLLLWKILQNRNILQCWPECDVYLQRYAMDGGFVYGNFIYFPIIYFSNSNIVGSRLVRFCTTDPTFQSYAELPIQCSYSGQIFNRLMAAHLGDSHTSSGKALYVSFNEDRTGSALCIFEMSAIIEAFTTSARSCNRDIVGEACDQTVRWTLLSLCQWHLYRTHSWVNQELIQGNIRLLFN